MHLFKSIIPNTLRKPLEEVLDQFSFNRILVALSGGPDSLALFHTLIGLKRKGLVIAAAHVDHGWREESAQQAAQLKLEVESNGLVFHQKNLGNLQPVGNLEQFCRNERLKFFEGLCHFHHYQAVFLAHHQDDLVETILKRVLEGASLPKISGMEKVQKWNNLSIVRPWLTVTKGDLIQFLKNEKISFFDDYTNLDQRFLRARMRTKILPELNQQFGKSVASPLLRLAEDCKELTAFMNQRVSPFLKKEKHLDCQLIESYFETKWLIREWIKLHNLSISHAALTDIAKGVFSKSANLKIIIGAFQIQADRGRLYLINTSLLNSFADNFLLNFGEGKWGEWSIKVEKYFGCEEEVIGWENAWKGNLTFFLPEGEFYLKGYQYLAKNEKCMMQKKWTNEKIPAFFRCFVPLIVSNEEVFLDCLSQKKRLNKGPIIPYKKVILYRESLVC